MPLGFNLIGKVWAASSVFDPASLSLTGWWREYTGTPWVGTASAGTSGTHNLSTGSPAPTLGTLNGHGTANYDGATESLLYTGSLADLISTGTGTIVVLFFGTSAVADSGVWYAEPAFIATDSHISEFGFCFSDAGVIAGNYDGAAFNRLAVPANIGAWHMASYTWDGAQLRVRVDNGAYQTVAAGAIASIAPYGAESGMDPTSNTVFYNGYIAELITSDTVISDANLDNLRTYMNTRYGVSV